MIHDGSSGSAEAGFTLLELLVALALMAVIATMMSVAVRQLHPMQALQQRIGEREAAAAIVDAIARDLQATARLPLIEAGSSSSALLRGELRKIVFSAVVPTGYQRRALREVTYELTKSDDGTRLLRTTRMRRVSQDHDAVQPQVDELWAGELDLRLGYLSYADAGGPVWGDQFQAINSLPRAVAIALALPDAPRREVRRIVVLEDRMNDSAP
jgi:prepilin-type N-terminal cleavage/methylation domain-containing protein